MRYPTNIVWKYVYLLPVMYFVLCYTRSDNDLYVALSITEIDLGFEDLSHDNVKKQI